MSTMMSSMNSNLKSKINAFNSNGKKSSEEAGKSGGKISNSISERIRKLSDTNALPPTATVTTAPSSASTNSITIATSNPPQPLMGHAKNGKVVEIEKVYVKKDSASAQNRNSRFDGDTSNRTSFFNRINDNIKKNSEKVAPASSNVSTTNNTSQERNSPPSSSVSNTNISVNIKKNTSNSNNFTITIGNSDAPKEESASDSGVKSSFNGKLSNGSSSDNMLEAFENGGKTEIKKSTATKQRIPETVAVIDENFGPSIDSSNSSTNTIDCSAIPGVNPKLAEEEDMSITSSCLALSHDNSENKDTNYYAKKFAEAEYLNQQLKLENDTLHEELLNIRHEMEELQDQFRLDDADEFRQLQAELEIAAKNCRILQFKLRKLEKRNETLETEKILIQEKMDEYSREAVKIIDLEEELLIAKEVSIRLHGELEQAQEWRSTAEKLNKELKKQLDDLKDYLDNEIKGRNATEDYNELVLVNKLYESMFREYFLQEQIYSMSNNAQTANVTKQLREVTDLISSYQQKIALLNEELDVHKNQLISKDKELEQFKIQLKNLKRSRSSEGGGYARRQLNLSSGIASTPENKAVDDAKTNTDPALDKIANLIIHSSSSKYNEEEALSSSESNRSKRASSVDSVENSMKQAEMAKDEIKLLRNKIARLEDDLMIATQERDHFSSQLEKIEEKAMKSFTTSIDNEPDAYAADFKLGENSTIDKQMSDLKKKIEFLNSEAIKNEETKKQLTTEVKQLRGQLDQTITTATKYKKSSESDSESSKNLTDEYKSLRSELNEKSQLINSLQTEMKQNAASLAELRKQIEVKENSLSESVRNESSLSQKLAETSEKLYVLNKKLEEQETSLKKLKVDFDCKTKLELELKADNQKINTKLSDFSAQLQEKLNEIEFLNRENNTLQERVNLDEAKLKANETEITKLKYKIDDLNCDIDFKNNEMAKIESLIVSKETEIGDFNKKLNSREMTIKWKLEEFERNRKELDSLRIKYVELSESMGDKVTGLSKEIDLVNKEKEQLQAELSELKCQNEKCIESKSQMIEIDNEKIMLQKLESQALNAKYENKIQYLEVETDTLRSKIRKLLKEKEIQDQVLKENQLLVKEIAMKYATDSETWNRQKQKLMEKEKLYEESVEMRKELKKAADKLRQKLQSLEEQIIEKQNKHTVEKNSWETQRIQMLSTNNKLEEQLAKLSTLKRSKKEIESAWERERKEILGHVANLENFVKDLQTQLALKSSAAAQAGGGPFGLNERITSVTGENEFLKNRIKEMEIMLDEMEQVKRFLFDVKDAYDADRHEWLIAKEDFKTQLEVKENLWVECYLRLNEIVNVIRALQQNEPLRDLHLVNGADFAAGEDLDVNKNESLNNLVGGTTNLLELKLCGGRSAKSTDSPRLNASFHSHAASFDSQSQQLLAAMSGGGGEKADLQIIDLTKDRKDLDGEFEQAFKKISRVKDNYSTHKKFMDIVKSKSMKALNRKTSSTSLSMNEIAQQQQQPQYSALDRGSMPPNLIESSKPFKSKSKQSGSSAEQRAKSVSKEPALTREDSQKSNDSSSNSSLFTSSRFFSLTRKIGEKIRFRTSSQPPAPLKSASNLLGHNTDQDNKNDFINCNSDYQLDHQHLDAPGQTNKISTKSQSSQFLSPASKDDLQDESSPITLTESRKSSLRERALSPSKLLNSLRARSPFGRSRNSRASSATPTPVSSSSAMATTTTSTISGKNKGFTISLNNQPIESIELGTPIISRNPIEMCETADAIYSPAMAANKILHRFIRSNTQQPCDQYGPSSQLRSMSCEFTDNASINSSSNATAATIQQQFKHLDEFESEGNSNNAENQSLLTNSSFSASTSNAIKVSTKTVPGSKVEMLRKTFMESQSNSADIVKSVKFKDVPEKTLILVDEKGIKSSASLLNVDSRSATGRSAAAATSVSVHNSVTNSPVAASSLSAKSKILGIKARTVDFPDLLQNTLESSVSGVSIDGNNKLMTMTIPTNSKPIQSILRRSETPPNTKANLKQQMSVESNDSNIEKLLKSSTSTSRPLMFNN